MKIEHALRTLQSIGQLCLLAAAFGGSGSAYAQSSVENGVVSLTLSNLLNHVLERNEALQSKLLEMEVGRRRARAEHGIFEPELFGSAEHVVNSRENTAEQESSQLSDFFSERNNLYQGGVEGMVPSGLRVRLGYSL